MAGQEGGVTDGEDNKRARGWGWREGQERRCKGCRRTGVTVVVEVSEEGGATGHRGGRRAGIWGAKGRVGQVGWMVGWGSAVDVGQGWSTVGVEREILVVRMSDILVRKGVAMVGKAKAVNILFL